MADAHNIQSWLNGDKLRSKAIREQYPLIGLFSVYSDRVSVCQTAASANGHQERDAGCQIQIHDHQRAADQQHAAITDRAGAQRA